MNSVTMIGRNEMTVPTPVITPSMTSEWITGFTSAAVSAASMAPEAASTPVAMRSERLPPMRSNVSQNTTIMMPTKHGIAVKRPVSTRSMRAERSCSRLSCGFLTQRAQMDSMNEKRMSARAARRSEPDSSSIWEMMCSTASSSFFSRPSALMTSSSPSMSLVAA